MRRRWALGMKIKRDAEELYLEPDVQGWPANTLDMIVAELQRRYGAKVSHIDSDTILAWANEPSDSVPYTWYEMRIIGRASPSITSASSNQGMSWKELILHKIETQDVQDRQAAEMIKAKASLTISSRDAVPANLIEAVSLQQAAENRTRPKRVID